MNIEMNFEHRQLAHCENGVVSNLLRYYGIDLSEPMIFGIGSGYFFSHMPFLKVDNIPVTSFRPLPGIIFKRVSKRLGFRFEKRKYGNPQTAMEALDNNLAQKIPTGMLVGVYHLTYFPTRYRFHFNAHNIVVYGKTNDNYLISDPIMEKKTLLTRKELMRVRYAKGTFAPKGHMYWLKNVPESFDVKTAVIKGIKHTCKDMTSIPVPMFGAKGIKFLSKKFRQYPEKLGAKKASLFTGQIVRAQEEIGTGGAGFRYMYAAFLQEAAKVIDKPELKDLSYEMTAIGDKWREFAVIAGRIVKNRAKEGEDYNAAADILLELSQREQQFFTKLKKAVV